MMLSWIHLYIMRPMVYRPLLNRLRCTSFRSASALALTFFLILLIAQGSAYAVSLRKPQIRSSTGEVLKVDIDLSSVSQDESKRLQVSLAEESEYQATGITRPSALEDATITLITRADGSQFIRILGAHPVSDPFVEILLNVRWATGSILRDIGVFLGTQSVGDDFHSIQNPQTSSAMVGEVRVNAGDTASKIVLQHMHSDQLTLEQMLLALLKDNPDAFIKNNVNLLKAGAELKIPQVEQALRIERDEAQHEVTIQAAAFAKYKATLANKLPLLSANSNNKSAGGRIKGQISASKDKRDQLKLSAPQAGLSAQKNVSEEELLAQKKQMDENKDRTQNLLNNLEDLNQLAQSVGINTKNGLLSGLNSLANVHTVSELNAWINSNFILVLFFAFVLCCLVFLIVWLRINKSSPPPTQHNSPSNAPTSDTQSPDMSYADHREPPVFEALAPQSKESAESYGDVPKSENASVSNTHSFAAVNTQSQSATTPVLPSAEASALPASGLKGNSAPANAVKFDFDLDLPPKKHNNSANNPVHNKDIEDPFKVRLDLAEELWKLGQKHTGRALAQEVLDQASEPMKEKARQWLSEHP